MLTNDRAPRRARLRLRSALSAAAATALALTGLATAVVAAPAAAIEVAPLAQEETCPPDGSMPPLGNEPTFTDSGVAVYVGGDYLAAGNAAESEGLLVVVGNATFDRDSGSGFDVGTAGVGSGIAPAGGEPMLQVGGDLTVTTPNTLRVGLLVGGGEVQAGGTITGTVDSNSQTQQSGMGQTAALDPYNDFGSLVDSFSSEWGALPATGTTLAAGSSVSFTSQAGATGTQVFSIDAGSLSGKTEFGFNSIPADAPIVINVVGGPVSLGMSYATINGTRIDDPLSTQFGNFASRILWNFVDATAVDITGSGQFMGSIVAPDADVTTTASTNGRVYVGGDFTTRGTGNEQHNYPWTGGGPLSCVPATAAEVGGFVAAKALTGSGDALVPNDTEFTIDWTATLDGGTVGSGTLTLLADGTVVDGPQDLPVGAIVTITEVNLPVVANVTWGTPVISPNEFVVEAQHTVAVTVTNEATSTVQPPVGGFSAKKTVTGSAAALVPASSQFGLSYAYTLSGQEITGELRITADGTVVNGPQGLPVGTVVTFAELDPPTVDGVEWGGVTISPSTVTVAADANTEVTVTNTANTPSVVLGGFSAAKSVTGPAAGLVPADTGFTLAYEYAIEDETVTGTLSLLADGTVVDGPQNLPVGTVVSFEEVELPAIAGVVWGEPVLSAIEITVEAGANTRVTVTNTATAPATPTTPSTPAADGEIAHTGVDGLVPTIAAAALLVAAGVALVIARRRRRA
ncbi:choice-of-anchor A family protein [Agromyces soli]